MKIFKVIQNFFQSKFGKRDINDRLRSIAQKFDEVVVPSLEKAAEAAANHEPASKYGKTFYADFLRRVPRGGRGPSSYFLIAGRSFKNARQLITLLEELVRKEIPDSLYIDGITYQKATLLRLIELLDFTADYASRQLCYLVASETNVTVFGKPADNLPFTKAEEKLIVSQQGIYFRALELFYGDAKDIVAQLHKIPEVLVVENEASDLPTLRQSELDPMQFGIIPVVSWLWQLWGETLVDWEYERYERAKKEKRDIELRIEFIKQKANGSLDARSEAILNGYNRELTLLRDQIETTERKIRR